MGCFTQYCCICSGPGQNFYDHYNDDENDKGAVYEENKNTEWLDNVQVICKEYITGIGEYNSYGQVEIEGDDNLYNVTPSVWGSYDFIDGLLIHSICLSMLKKYMKDFNNKRFFNVFKNYVNDYCIFRNIDYQGIENNLGQNYEVKEGEEYSIENPYITTKISLENKINKKKYIIPKFLSHEIQNIIFEYLDFKSMCTVSPVCYFWYILSIDNKYWINLLKDEYDFYEIERNKENNIKELFKLYYLDKNIKDKIKNRKRIINCINQINLLYQKN